MRSTAPERVLDTTGRRAFAQHAKRTTETFCCYQPVSRPESIIRQLNFSLAVSFFKNACVSFWKTKGYKCGCGRVGEVPRQGDENGGPDDGNRC